MRFVVLGSMDPNDEDFWSGIPAHVIRALRRNGHDVVTIGPLFPQVRMWERLKGRYYRHLFGKSYMVNRDPAVLRARARQANALLRKQETPDAVLVFSPPDAAYLQCPVPLILVHDATWHQVLDFYPGYERHHIAPETLKGGYELDRLTLENCDIILYSSRWAAQSAIDDYGIDKNKIVVCSLGASLTRTPSHDDLKQWISQRGHAPCQLLFVGFDWQRKGGNIAIAAAKLLRDRGLQVELQIVGSSPSGAIPSFVRVHGRLSKNNPIQAGVFEQLFAKADFFLLPTRADCTPLVFNEAAAYGLPIAATLVGGVGDIIRDESWGKLFEPNASPEAYAAWLHTIYSDRKQYERMAWAARRDFEERLNWDVFCRKLVAVAAELQATRRQGAPLGR